MEYKETVKKVIAEVCRLLLGVVFIFSGTVKAVAVSYTHLRAHET
mgnify:CR=1 FL=1